jgi:acetyl-CoA acyltransferase 2
MIFLLRLCGSGFQSVVFGAQEIALGDSQVVLCGGSENMTLAPFGPF